MTREIKASMYLRIVSRPGMLSRRTMGAHNVPPSASRRYFLLFRSISMNTSEGQLLPLINDMVYLRKVAQNAVYSLEVSTSGS